MRVRGCIYMFLRCRRPHQYTKRGTFAAHISLNQQIISVLVYNPRNRFTKIYILCNHVYVYRSHRNMKHKKLITLTPRRKRVIEVMVSSGHAKNEMDAVMRCIDLAATELLKGANL